MKKLIVTLGLMGVLLVSGMVAKPAHLMSDFQGSETRQSCKETRGKSNTDWAIFVTALVGTIFTGYTGTIYTGSFTRNDDKTTSTSCGN